MSENDQPRDGGEEASPKALFKYLAPGRVSDLRDLLIRFTQASSLNDTLELRPPIKGVAAPERLEKITREGLVPALKLENLEARKGILRGLCPGLPELVEEIFLQTYTRRAMQQIEDRHKMNPNAVFERMDQNFGILSLTETPTDVRMWGHYADGGRGFLIEFDPGHPWFHAKREARDSFRHMRQVDYVSSRPAKHLLDVTELEFLYTKWDVWREEQEWRIIRSFKDAAKKLEKTDSYGNDILLFAIPPKSIKSVVIGFSASAEFEISLRRIVSESTQLEHVQIGRAIQSVETGRVEIVPGNPNPKLAPKLHEKTSN